MIDFTNCIEEFNSYKGKDKKKTLIYNGKKYLVKFPNPVRDKNINISYINNAFSEYVGSNIFKLTGFLTQETILGKYNYNGKEKIVCGCEDFTDNNHLLYEFESLALSSNPDKKIETEIEDIMSVIDESKNLIDDLDTKEKFWNMFVIDSIIGNTDRHNGNWGFLVNKLNNEIKFSYIYDCGSCLNPMLEDNEIEKLNDNELKNLAVNCYSCLKESGKKINYMSYIKNMKNNDVNKAIVRVFNNIDINKLNSFIDNIEGMSNTRKNFYKYLINYRYNIIHEVYNKLNKEVI
jgi:hypothetical protein